MCYHLPPSHTRAESDCLAISFEQSDQRTAPLPAPGSPASPPTASTAPLISAAPPCGQRADPARSRERALTSAWRHGPFVDRYRGILPAGGVIEPRLTGV